MSTIEMPYKILILGESYVGKTSILYKFSDDTFKDNRLNTIGIDFEKKDLNIDNKVVRLQIWDTAGQERYYSITKSFYRRANGILLVFSMSDPRSFECIDRWFNDIKKEIDSDVPIFLIGNKLDLADKDTDLESFKEKAKKMNLRYYETSAYNGTNIQNVFIDMAREMMKKDSKNINVHYKIPLKKKKKRCC